MKHATFVAHCLATPWALQREVLAAHAAILAHHIAADSAPAAAGDTAVWAATAAEGQAAATRTAGAQRTGNGSIAVIPVVGTIMQRAGMIEMCGGGISVQTITRALREAQADETVGQILLEIDSPGGSVYGVAELAAEIARSSKPVVAIANSLAASAAYWIGCAATEFYCTPSGEVGSIGVWQAHEDWSAAMEQAGIKTTLISAGKYKVEGNPYESLSTEARDFMQSRVQDYYDAFVKGVARGRKVSVEAVRSGMGQGRVLGAQAAQAENMIDGVMTFDEVIRHMQRQAKAQRAAGALRRSLQQAKTRLLEVS